MDRDIWVDAFENLESLNSSKSSRPAEVVHSSSSKAVSSARLKPLAHKAICSPTSHPGHCNLVIRVKLQYNAVPLGVEGHRVPERLRDVVNTSWQEPEECL